MTWQEQVSALKRQLSAKSKHSRKRWKRNERESRVVQGKCEPVIVRGKVDAAFLDRMRAMGVRVEVQS